MTEQKRIESLDLLRGFAMILIILFHTSIYNFANIHKLDFSDPPIIVVLMSFMALWGGVFIMYSMVVNTIMMMKRSGDVEFKKIFLWSVLAGAVYLVFHYILNIVTGRWNIDFVNNQPHMTLIAGSLRNHQLSFPYAAKFFEGSSLSTIAWNLIIMSGILFLLLKKNSYSHNTRNYLILGLTGTAIMIFSFIRVPLFHFFSDAVGEKNFVSAILLSFVISNPYPLLPYLGYGFIGTMLGMMIHNNEKKLLRFVCIPLGIFFLVFGFAGMTEFDKTISKPDYFWYFKTQFELGVFILMILLSVLVIESSSLFSRRFEVIKWFGRISLTIYMFETVTSEVLRFAWFRVTPLWDQTINGCLTFGFANILLWIIVLFFWSRRKFRFSIEYFLVKLFKAAGKDSSQLDAIQGKIDR
jgi:surface polysaccharide O-acyltransferase-like enzyme